MIAGRRHGHQHLASCDDVVVDEAVTGADTPDFAKLFGTGGSLTPRMGCRLWSGALTCGDTWRLAREDPRWLIDELPPIARPWARPASPWLDRFISCFYDLADRIAVADVAEDSLTTCTGDEMALHLVIDFAEAEFDSGMDTEVDTLCNLPIRGHPDADFELVRDALLQDNDVPMLFDPSLDGIDEPDSGHRTVNLHPNRWFLPFSCE
jgi:hypothetical protein